MPARRILPLALLTALATGCLNEVEVTPQDQRTPVVLASVSQLDYAALTGSADPAPRTITVANGGGGTLARPTAVVTMATGSGWLSASVDGTAAPYTVTVQVALGALTAGTYTGAVRLESAGAARTRTIPVTLVLTDPRPPELVPSSATLSFSAIVGGANPVAQVVTITNGGDLPLQPPAASISYGPAASGWLSADLAGTAAPYALTVRAAAAGLAAGTYTGSVDLTSAGAAPVSIVVTLTVSAPRTVTVTRLVTPWTEAGAGAPLVDAALQGVTLKQEDGAGGFTSATATQGPPGTWTGTIGPGAYWAVAAWADGTQTWVRASASTLDLGADLAGRADATRATAATTATLNLRALEPWDTLNDVLSVVSYGAQAGAVLDASTTPPVPLGDGEIDLLGFGLDWRSVGPLLAPGDRLWLSQLRFRFSGTLDYLETKTFSSLTGVSMASGTAVTLNAPDAQFITGTGQLLLDWRRSQFEAALPPSTSTSTTAHAAGVTAIPARLEAPSPFGAWAVPLLLAFLGQTTDFDPDFSAGSLSYGTFLPAGWNQVFSASLTLDVERTAPGATTPAPGLRNQVVRNDAIAAAPNPVVPRIGGVLAPTIDGADALTVRSNLSTTPRLAWGAPATGTATSYLVEVQRLIVNGTATEAQPVALFVLDGTSLTVPAGILERGRTYVARLVARSNPGDAGGASPFRVGVPYGEAGHWTERFTTAP